MSERTPPHNADAERELLGTCIMKPPELDSVSDIKPTDLYLPEHRVCWEALQGMRLDGDKIEPLTVEARMGAASKGLAWVIDLLAFTTAAGAQPAARIISETARLRKTIALCAEVQARCYQEDPMDEVVADMRKQLVDVEVSGAGAGPTLIADTIGKTLEVIERRAEHPERNGVGTGNDEYDRKIGTLQPGHLCVVAGLPGMGKSSYAQGIVEHAANRNTPCLVFCFEMPKQEQNERLLAATSQIHAYQIKTGKLDSVQWQRITEAAAKISDYPIYTDTRSLTISQIVGESRRWYAKHAQGSHALIVVDYLQLVRTEGKKQNRERDVADISTGLKHLAMTDGMDITVMALSQLNRLVAREGREPTIQDLRESGQIEADADTIVFPWRELVKDDESGNRRVNNESGECKLIVGKNRGGRTGRVGAFWNAPLMRFHQLAADEFENWQD